MKGLNEINPFTGRPLARSLPHSVGQVKEISAHPTMGGWNEMTELRGAAAKFGGFSI